MSCLYVRHRPALSGNASLAPASQRPRSPTTCAGPDLRTTARRQDIDHTGGRHELRQKSRHAVMAPVAAWLRIKRASCISTPRAAAAPAPSYHMALRHTARRRPSAPAASSALRVLPRPVRTALRLASARSAPRRAARCRAAPWLSAPLAASFTCTARDSRGSEPGPPAPRRLSHPEAFSPPSEHQCTRMVPRLGSRHRLRPSRARIGNVLRRFLQVVQMESLMFMLGARVFSSLEDGAGLSV